MHKSFFTPATKILLFTAVFLVSHAAAAHAAIETQLYPVINSAGETSDNTDYHNGLNVGCPFDTTEPTTTAYVMGQRVYQGQYPDRSHPLYSRNNGSPQVCPVYYNSASYGYTLQNYWANNTIPTTSPGYYWVEMTNHGVSYSYTDWSYHNYFWGFYFNGSSYSNSISGAASPQDVTIIEPTPYGTTTATTSVNIQINYKAPATIDPRPTTTRTYIISDAVTGVTEYRYTHVLPANTTENYTLNDTINLTPGSKILTAYYGQYSSTTASTSDPAPYTPVQSTFFNVITNTYLAATGIDNPNANTATTTVINCSLYDVGCQFQKAMVFLFYPSPTILTNLGNTWQQLGTKVPFGYITVSITELQSLNMDAAPAFTISTSTMPFWSTIFEPARTALAGMLWAIFLIYFFLYRLRHIEI